jgi:hypothetical protein
MPGQLLHVAQRTAGFNDLGSALIGLAVVWRRRLGAFGFPRGWLSFTGKWS